MKDYTSAAHYTEDSTQRRAAVSLSILKAAVESANDAVIITEARLDRPGPRIEYVNPAFSRMTGYDAVEVLGKTPRILQGPNTDIELIRRLRHDLETTASFHGETVNYRKDGSEYAVEWRITPIVGEDGKIALWVAIQRDVTTRKIEEERREHLLENERVARVEAERANRMKDEFLATLSHELRTPINAVLGWVQVIKRGKQSSDDMKESLNIIERNARNQAQLIDDLLDMNRIMSGTLKLDVQRVDLSEVVKAALETVKPAADAKQLTIGEGFDPFSKTIVSGDPARLQQVVWNLLFNAVKFTPRGGKVWVLLERHNSHVSVCVSDDGVGIQSEFLPYVFDRFRQSDSSTTRRFGGLGLGLAIVRHLVELHGGTVHVASAGKNQGATFTVHLPVAVIDLGASYTQWTAALSEPDTLGSTFTLKGVRVLVVDDEMDARELVKRIIEEYEGRVTLAASADEALELIELDKPDIIVSDIGMPDKDGYQLMRELRLKSGYGATQLPAIALTAFARSEDRRRILLAGYQMHVTKPADASELLIVVGSLLGRHPLEQVSKG